MECAVENEEKEITKRSIGAIVLTIGLFIYLVEGLIKLYTPMFSPWFQEFVLETGWVGLIQPTWYLIVLGFTFYVVIPQIQK